MDQVSRASPSSVSEVLRWRGRDLLWPAIVLLTLVKLVVAASTPLAFDEALYWRYSTYLGASYIDHPFLNPLLIHIGTLLFGQTPLGVRFCSVLLTLPASWAVWITARVLYGPGVGRTAVWFFNISLVGAVCSLVATSDQVVVTTTCLLMAALAKLQRTGKGYWWLVFGALFGLGMCAKFTTLFVGAGALVWLALTPRQLRWVLTPWPWAGAVLAAVVFSPVIAWNASHGWAEFLYQGGRLTVFHWTVRYLLELLVDLIILAGPPLALLGVAGLAKRPSTPDERDGRAFLLAFAAPMTVFFAWYATHKRVQGNWPEPVIPALLIAAACAAHQLRGFTGLWGRTLKASAWLATPVGLSVAGLVYLEAAAGFLPLGAHDPRERVLAIGWDRVAERLLQVRQTTGAEAIITTDYPLASWLRFYLPAGLPVEQIDDRMRWINEPQPDPSLFQGVLMYVCKAPCAKIDKVERRFRSITPIAVVPQNPQGRSGALYRVYRVSGPTGPVLDYRLYGADHRDD